MKFIDSAIPIHGQSGNWVYKVWSDGTYVYAAQGEGWYAGHGGGIHVYSFDGSTLTFIESDGGGMGTNRRAQSVFGDGKFVYLANGYGGVRSYDINAALQAAGNL